MAGQSPIKTVVFDFGNVIGFFDHRRTTRRLLQWSAHPEDQLHRLVYGGPLETAYEHGRLTSAEFVRQVKEVGCLTCPEEEIASAWSDVFWPNEETVALVPELSRRYTLLLGSNTNELHAVQFKRQFRETLKHFHALVLSHEVGARKPQPEFFKHCQRLAGCAAKECLFIDDLEVNVDGARQVGWQGIVYRPGGELKQQLANLGLLSTV